jgi:hypothetical protein
MEGRENLWGSKIMVVDKDHRGGRIMQGDKRIIR